MKRAWQIGDKARLRAEGPVFSVVGELPDGRLVVEGPSGALRKVRPGNLIAMGERPLATAGKS